jgi:hypothetical protein
MDDANGDGLSREAALSAPLTLGRYVSEMNDPTTTRKIEALLASFNRQLRIDAANAMKTSYITDYCAQI